MRPLAKSFEYWERAEKVIPCGTQTLSKGPERFVKGAYPIYLDRGEGSHVFDVDGNEYIDYPMALGPIILGYNYPAMVAAVIEQLLKGATFSLMHPVEVKLAELICECVPCAEMVRYGKNGADATSAAVRLARAHTGRDKIAHSGYHGYSDWYMIGSDRPKGIPAMLRGLIHSFKWNEIESLERIFKENKGEVAAVIMEMPLGADEPQDGFLHKVRKLAHQNGALFILDEVQTGFRYALGGIQEYYGVIPDLACFGKGVANGMPLSVVAGPREIMRGFEEVFYSTTYGGETLSLAAAIATIREIRNKNVIPYIWEKGKRLQDGYNRLAGQIGVSTKSIGQPPRTTLRFYDADGYESDQMRGLFMQEAVKRGVLFGVPVFISFSHTDEDIGRTLAVCEDSLKVLKKAVDEENIPKHMEGEFPAEVFKRT